MKTLSQGTEVKMKAGLLSGIAGNVTDEPIKGMTDKKPGTVYVNWHTDPKGNDIKFQSMELTSSLKVIN